MACFKDWLKRGCCHVIVPDSGQPQWVGFTTDAPPASRQTYYDRVIRFGLRAPEHFWEWEVPTPSNPLPPPYSGTEAAMALAGGPDEGVDLDAILALAPCYVGGYITP